ncbi:hypothetical protein ACIOHE_26620 [Streptomyces sp. NPDC087851]|uniref:hypothetical protein n=1 Tax=Streptomyces sp. NPDC087851 TaxID=3365810 RepID=UPI0038061C8E
MRNSEIRRLDREIRQTEKKLEALRGGSTWPLNSRERRAMARATVGGISRAQGRIGGIASVADTRLTAELTALYSERQRLVTENSRAKTPKKSTRRR